MSPRSRSVSIPLVFWPMCASSWGRFIRKPRIPSWPGKLINRPHDEEHIGQKTRGIDTERERGDILPARLLHQLSRLPGVKEVTQEDRDRRAGQDTTSNQLRRKPAHDLAQDGNKHELEQVVDKQTEKSVDITVHEPARLHRRGS